MKTCYKAFVHSYGRDEALLRTDGASETTVMKVQDITIVTNFTTVLNNIITSKQSVEHDSCEEKI